MRPTQGYSSYRFCYLSSNAQTETSARVQGLLPPLATCLVEVICLSFKRVTLILELKFEIFGPINTFFSDF